MIIHTFFDKCNTIFENSEFNTGYNPVAELNAGSILSRILIHFDLNKLKQQLLNGEIDVKNLQHKIKMTNCGTVNLPIFKDKTFVGCKTKTRASSFDIIAFRMPFEWDGGRGFDYNGDYVKDTHKVLSKDGSNWFQSSNGVEWDEYGVYTYDTLSKDYFENFGLSEDAIIIARQHFDTGTENLEIDITDYINKVLTGEKEFYGIGLAFSPRFENTTVEDKFISFFTHKTNTFFAPYLETINSDVIIDNRANFHIGSKNRLYFFAIDNGEFINLDKLPICTINDETYNVKQGGKGIYYVELTLENGSVEPNTIMYDKWSNIVFNGQKMNDIEMEFVVLPMEERISLGMFNKNKSNLNYEPQLSGINDKERLKIGDIREIIVDFIEAYSYGTKIIPYYSEFRLYVKENNREIDIFQYQPIERKFDNHTFIIDTNNLLPNTYHIDIKVKQGNNIKVFENVLEFLIVSNVTDFYK